MAMRSIKSSCILLAAAALILGTGNVSAARSKRDKKDEPSVSLNATGSKLQRQYSSTLKSLQEEIAKSLPSASESKKAAFEQASENLKKAEAAAEEAQKAFGAINSGKALVEHAKGKWIGGAEKGIAQAEAALKNAKTAAEKDAAKKDLAKWQANKEDGLKALKERQAAWDKARADEPKLKKALDAAQAALEKAQASEKSAAMAFMADLASLLSSDRLDEKLVKCTVLTAATPAGLAQFAQENRDNEAMVEKLLSDNKLMKDMLIAGGAAFGKYGRAMEIYTAIQKASPNAKEGNLQRLALATSLEHANPVKQSNAESETSAPDTVDPVKRYLHYEKAFLDGELDPAFKNLTAWEYRHVVDCDAPDEILSWGREMLRNYRPDHISNPNYGWRYVSTVKTEVPYGSQNVKYDLPSLQNYQNIIKDGGVCGRRAFFGRFILQAFGIPVWGVTQHAHAALSHWTPDGWVVNLGAGFEHSWWDKDEVSLSGTQFLLESKARAHPLEEYLKVLRAQWVSRVLGEEAYNERKKITGGFWSNVAHQQMAVLASKKATLGPLGQDLAEANESEDEQFKSSGSGSDSDQKAIEKSGKIFIPAVAHGKTEGKSMNSYPSGMQIHALGGFKAEYAFNAPQSGKYLLSAWVTTVQEGQVFYFSVKSDKNPVEVPVPYTLGMWQQTKPVEVTLERGRNTLNIELKQGSRGVSVKEFTLTPVK
jgi:chemotaxis protein histidine kinase CheA